MSSRVLVPDISSDTRIATTEYDDDTEIGVAVVEAVARAADTDPTDIESRVHDVVDADALDRCVRAGRSALSVSFPFDGYWVVVSGGGEIVVAEAPEL
ncbi:HalOD1 output domain-containing protein [Halorubrum sp. AD140]|uniref:HalOD1 output domain-containing protein n=1 Tax=Halorubrum sp. AD140 TaxID=3050073 RepID=UPI002ACC68C1|nr:HalOD1 output domain-containing protein [Halorubrum sp. AD140]MDZ5810244.1 HalOD1 output domain-containing protein [Halorubrum sp. AD140]